MKIIIIALIVLLSVGYAKAADSPYFIPLVNATTPSALLNAILAPFVNIFTGFGVSGSIFYGLMFATFIYMIYMKTQDIIMPTVITMIIGGIAMSYMPPIAGLIATAFVAISLAVILYSAFRGE